MCGLVGVIGDTASKEARGMFKNLLFFDTLRGEHSTGVFAIDYQTDDVEILKKAMPAPDFLQLRSVERMLAATNEFSVLVGHNRYATMGAKTSANAHPFQHGDITLVHNGTLRNERILSSYYKHTVDSEMLCDDFNSVGVQETIKKVQGAYALIWHDATDSTVNILRNTERPLYIGLFRKEKVKNSTVVHPPFIAFASERWMLAVAAMRNDIEIIDDSIESVKEHKQLKINIDGVYKERDPAKILDHIETIKVEPYAAPKSRYVGGKTSQAGGGKTTTGTSIARTNVSSIDSKDKRCRFVPTWAVKDSDGNEHYAYGSTSDGRSVRCLVDSETCSDIIAQQVRFITADKVAVLHASESTDGSVQKGPVLVLNGANEDAIVVKKQIPSL